MTAFWLFALATSLFSAMNERELRQRRVDLESLVAMGARLDDEGDPIRQAAFVLDGLVDRYAFPRGLVLGVADDGRGGAGRARRRRRRPPSAIATDPSSSGHGRIAAPIALRRLDPAVAPVLAPILPGAPAA